LFHGKGAEQLRIKANTWGLFDPEDLARRPHLDQEMFRWHPRARMTSIQAAGCGDYYFVMALKPTFTLVVGE
jgi:hypothetical protein